MNVNDLIGRFLEETNYDNHKDVVFMIAYGSRLMSMSKENSDLDILIITSQKGTYRQSLLIDGIPIDITIMSYEEAEQDIIYSQVEGATYFDTVLKNGQVVIDKANIYDSLKELLNFKLKKRRTIDTRIYDQAEAHADQFLRGIGDSNIHYFSALEEMRKLYHAKYNCSNMQTSKVFDLYIHKDIAKESYLLKLPNDKYIGDYLNALQETNLERQKAILMTFLKEFKDLSVISYEPTFFNDAQKKIRLISLNNAIWKCEDMILKNHAYSKAFYYILIGEIYDLYEVMNGTKLGKNIAIPGTGVEAMIQTLETLFSLVDTEHNIDYNNYKVKIY